MRLVPVEWRNGILMNMMVYVNGEEEQRRGKKLRHDDVINYLELGTFKIIEMTNGSSDVH